MILRLELAVIVASIAGALLWIEHGSRIDIETPAGAAFAAPVVRVCPDNENVPYSSDCIVFMRSDLAPTTRWQENAAKTMLAESAHAPESTAPPEPECPANDNVPYSARCVAFLSGWFWQANTMKSTVIAPAYGPK